MIIADDDFLVRTYLKQMIPWKKHGFLIVGNAKNGQEALELIEKEHPALIITDVCMPVLDGIGLIRAMRARHLPGHILVLSSHDDFAYVHEAMKLGIDDYLLKDDLTPENMLTFLKEHLKDAPCESEKEESPTASPASSVSNVSNFSNVSKEELARIGQEKLRHDFFLAFSRQGLLPSAEIPTAAERAGLPASFRLAAAFFLQLRGWQARRQALNEEERLSFHQAFVEMLQTFLDRHRDTCKGWPFLLDEESGFWGLILIFPDAVSRAALLPKLYETSRHLQTLVERYFDLRILLVKTAPQSDWAHLMTSYWALLTKKDTCFYLPDGIYTADELPAAKSSTSLSPDLSAEKFLPLLAKENLTKEALLSCLEKKFPQLTEASWAALRQAEDYKALQQELGQMLAREQAESQLHPSIRQALRFIEEHYHENLMQADIAAAVHLNPAYFSTLFKKNMNKGFSEYLAERRIKAVKQRLAESTERIKDIAAAEGFDDYPYFCRLFKRLVGLTPQEYRSQKI
ncbi:response regulator transcription factor [Mitsuokella sp. WILCCON 0060]|uniref:response regulator transcription factor n=1 Tax=unclassified Mitsuokella TaxID=2637239 RepID=UPI003F0DE7D0